MVMSKRLSQVKTWLDISRFSFKLKEDRLGKSKAIITVVVMSEEE